MTVNFKPYPFRLLLIVYTQENEPYAHIWNCITLNHFDLDQNI
jgi:hypothetical protein